MELLRTTTPEPSPEGIRWHVEKDVSDYMTFILDPLSPKAATLSIPNVIDSTYTGVIYVNATLSFYGRPPSTSTASSSSIHVDGDEGQQAQQPSEPPTTTISTAVKEATAATSANLRGLGGSGANMGQGRPPALDGLTSLVPELGARPPLVMPLAAPQMPMLQLLRQNKSGGGSGFWASVAVSGNQSLEVPLPPWPQPNIVRVHLDLFASPHQCEEVRRQRAW